MPLSIAITTSIVIITYAIFKAIVGLRKRKRGKAETDISVSIESPGGEKRNLRVFPDDIRSVDTLISEFSQSTQLKSVTSLKKQNQIPTSGQGRKV